MDVRLHRDGDRLLTGNGRWQIQKITSARAPGWSGWRVWDLDERTNFSTHGQRHYTIVPLLGDAKDVIAAIDPDANADPDTAREDEEAAALHRRAAVYVYSYMQATGRPGHAGRCRMLQAAASGAIKAYAARVGAEPAAVMETLVQELAGR